MITAEQGRNLLGATLYGSGGEKIGKVGQVFLDDETGRPEWLTVSTGMFGARESFVPIAEAKLSGSDATVSYDKDRISGAPNVDVDEGHLSKEEEAELYRYYGLSYSEAASDSGVPAEGTGGRTDSSTGTRSSSDDAMTRSEEQVRVGKESAETGRVKLRKYIETEQVQQTVPVTREEARVSREPITDANRGDALDGPDLSEEEHEVVLTEERPVVEKETVPVERVRLDKETVTEQQTVNTERRKEVIEPDVGTSDSGRTNR